jgi:hypothetical protein
MKGKWRKKFLKESGFIAEMYILSDTIQILYVCKGLMFSFSPNPKRIVLVGLPNLSCKRLKGYL